MNHLGPEHISIEDEDDHEMDSVDENSPEIGLETIKAIKVS